MRLPIPQAMLWKYGVACAKTPEGDDIAIWESTTIPQPSKAQIAIDVAEHEQFLIDEQIKQDALDVQIDSDKTSFPTRAQVMTAVDNINDLADAKVFLKKLANVVYTLRKNSVT